MEGGAVCHDPNVPLMGFKAIDDLLLPTRGELPEKQPDTSRGEFPGSDVSSFENTMEAARRVAKIVENRGAEVIFVHEDAIRRLRKFPINGNGPADIVTVMEVVAV